MFLEFNCDEEKIKKTLRKEKLSWFASHCDTAESDMMDYKYKYKYISNTEKKRPFLPILVEEKESAPI